MDVPRTNHRSRYNRRFMMVATGVVALVLLAFGATRLEPAAPSVDREQIIIDSVRRGEMVRAVRGPGIFVPERVRWIPAATGGRVERILVQPGDRVERGTVLLELSNPTYNSKRWTQNGSWRKRKQNWSTWSRRSRLNG